jgi:hypothetical protein
MWVNFGVERVIFVGFGALLSVGVLNVFLLVLDRPCFGLWVQEWARRYLPLAAALALFVGALAGHFFWATPG